MLAGNRNTPIDAAVFDLGGVLIDWNPRYLYRRLLNGDEDAVGRFLSEICTAEWNIRLDGGRPIDEGIAELVARHPEQAPLIRAWKERWEEMLRGPIEETVAMLEELHERGLPLYALTNWSAETFPIARRRFPFLARFRDVVVSGEEGVAKPDPAIFQVLLRRAGLVARRTVFVDDSAANVAAAQRLGFHAIRFTTAIDLRKRLAELGIAMGPA
ncbi:MAG: HAD family phosphatase [Rhodospirillales bacterium]|nr:HAD family phosphatase [Rhodospirillales bacterium]